MNSNWLDSYYEALEFFYWEPQHIGRKKNVVGEFNTIDKVVRHLRKIEVTLNHNISQFLLLAPKSLHRRLYNNLFARNFNLPFAMHGRGVDDHFELANAMQPDFLFISDNEVISIEMKVSAKSSIDQVLKYALLGLAVEIKSSSPRGHYLGFLGSGEFRDQWKEKFRTIADLRQVLDTVDVGLFLTKQPIRFRAFEARLREIVNEIEFGFINYEDFAEVLRLGAPVETDNSQGAEVYRNLIHGLLSELTLRELIE
jgi:hypothetical protein